MAICARRLPIKEWLHIVTFNLSVDRPYGRRITSYA